MLKYSEPLDQMVLFDDKPLFVQKEDHSRMLYQSLSGARHSFLVCDFDAYKMELGKLHEV